MKRKMQRNLSEVLKDEMFMQNKVMLALKDEPKTIPEIAQQLNYPAAEVTTWVMAMRRFGKIAVLPKGRADDYFQYKLAEDKL
jgi:predicted Rossmann fold nucleotide-binding protein DprA/Smf involved in DNA uptake